MVQTFQTSDIPYLTFTDITTVIVSICLLVSGFRSGFMHSLAGPFSIIVATVASIAYYQATKDVIISLIIGLLGPLLLALLLKFTVKTWTKATNKDIASPGFLSRMAGMIITLSWGWVFVVLTLILLTVLPPWGNPLRAIHTDVTRSFSYLLVKPLVDLAFAEAKEKNSTTAPASQQPSPSSASSSSVDAKSLAEDPRFQKILQDPEIQKEIDAHDMGKLMSNPKIMDLVQQIMNDPATMSKVLTLYQNQTQPPVTKNP